MSGHKQALLLIVIIIDFLSPSRYKTGMRVKPVKAFAKLPLPSLRAAFADAAVAHIAVDIQRAYCDPTHPYGRTIGENAYRAGRLAAPISRFAETMRSGGLTNIWVAHNFKGTHPFYVRNELFRVHHTPDDATVTKRHFDAFENTALHRTLRNNNTRVVLITGAFFNQCVQATAFSAVKHGYEAYVVRDLTVPTGSIHDSLLTAERLQTEGVRLITSSQVLRIMNHARPLK